MTWQPSNNILAAALAHAEACQPAESCGVVAGQAFHPVPNRATSLDAFVMDMPAYLAIARQGAIEAIVHSHVHAPPKPSEADRTMCEATGKPWLIVSWPIGDHAVIEPCGWQAPLVGRQWSWGSHDCFSLVRDALKHYAGISIPDYDRQWEFWERGEDIIADQYAGAGFVAVDDGWRQCDVAAMRIWPSRIINHVGMFLAPDQILHQFVGRYSVREIYGGVYQSATALHLRHRDLAGRS